jgi:hypothetical protein
MDNAGRTTQSGYHVNLARRPELGGVAGTESLRQRQLLFDNDEAKAHLKNEW